MAARVAELALILGMVVLGISLLGFILREIVPVFSGIADALGEAGRTVR